MPKEGGVPFDSIDPDAQVKITGLIEQIALVHLTIQGGCSWTLLNMQMHLLNQQIRECRDLEIPGNTLIHPGQMISDEAAEALLADVEIPDTLEELREEDR